MRMVAAVLGGGTGQRIGAPLPKQLLTLAGRTLVEHCVAAFDQAPGIDEIFVLMAGGYVEQVRAMLADGGYRKVMAVIEGGATRPDSTRLALTAIAQAISAEGTDPADCGVLLHDAARPLVDQRIIADCVAALGVHLAAGVAVPASDTMVIAEDGMMHSMPRRETLWRCQTPQCFRLPVITRAHQLAAADAGPAAFAPPTTVAWCSATCPKSRCTSSRAASGTSRSPTRRTSPWPRRCSPRPRGRPATRLQVRRIVLDLGQLPDRRPLLQERLDGLA